MLAHLLIGCSRRWVTLLLPLPDAPSHCCRLGPGDWEDSWHDPGKRTGSAHKKYSKALMGARSPSLVSRSRVKTQVATGQVDTVHEGLAEVTAGQRVLS